MMRSGILIASLCLTAQAQAQIADRDRLDMMWTAYSNWCATVVADPDQFFDNVDLISQDAGVLLTPSSEGSVVSLAIVRPAFSFGLHTGHVKGHTFMSCGVSASDQSMKAAQFAPLFESYGAEMIPPDALIGGDAFPKELYYHDNGYSLSESPENYQYFAEQVVPGVDTVTFVQVMDGWVSLYFHHVFDGRVGLPVTPPQPIERLP